jgi:hypothetical protein
MITFRKIAKELAALGGAFRRDVARARADGGVGPVRQVLDMVRLRLGPGKLEPRDYYRMRVYRRDLPFERKREFASQRALRLSLHWHVVTHDKLIASLLMEHEGLRIPETYAICHPLRSWGVQRVLRSPDQIVQHLTNSARYPFISKPVAGMYSKGVVLVERLEPDSGLLRVAEEEPVPLRQFAEECILRPDGTIFQEVLRPHPEIAAHISDRLCTLRLIVLLEHDDVHLFRALWKIAAGGNVADNYWHPGNLIARLDPGTGCIEQCMTGLGPDFRLVERHPVTGQVLRGFQVPLYREAVELTRRVARAFVGVKIQAWDIAITPEGPIPLEINDIGSVFLPQTADQRGIYDRSFREFVAQAKRG